MAHPYMPNAIDALKAEMLAVTGAGDVADLFAQVPAAHRLRRPLTLSQGVKSEAQLRRRLGELLGRTTSCEQALSFLGAGTYRHHVPAVCDELIGRYEWATSIMGTSSSDHGRYQAWFEWASQLGELLELDFLGLPVYSHGAAAGHALRMAARMTRRTTVLVANTVDPQRRAVIANYCGRPAQSEHLDIVPVGYGPGGQLDMVDLAAKLGPSVAAVYFESPNAFGIIESDAREIVALASAQGTEVIEGVDPLTLGVLSPPGARGVKLAVGTVQTMGVHMNAGGGIGGFIASVDDERYVREYPTLQVSACPTLESEELGFSEFLFEQTSYGAREQGKDWTGNSTYFWTIANAAFMALLGPEGFREVGLALLQRSHYAARRITEVPGVRAPFGEGFMREVVVDFTSTGRTVREINDALRERGVFGGIDLSEAYPELGQSALYCVTEMHTQADIDRLVNELREVLA